MMKSIVIQNISSTKEWEKFFQFALVNCDQFTITFPDGEYDAYNPLMGGLKEFKLLKDIEVNAAPGMDEGVIFSGKLTGETVALFENNIAPSYSGFKPSLWSFQLLKDHEPWLEVSDFTVCLLYMSMEMEYFLEKESIDINSLIN